MQRGERRIFHKPIQFPEETAPGAPVLRNHPQDRDTQEARKLFRINGDTFPLSLIQKIDADQNIFFDFQYLENQV